MRILFLKYLAFLLLGMVIGVYALGEYTKRQTSPIEEFASVQAQVSEEPPVIVEYPKNSGEDFLDIIRGKDAEIANLKTEIARMKTLADTAAAKDSQKEFIQTMSVEEMAATVGESLRNQFKNRVLTMSDDQMKAIKQSFNDEPYSEWGMAYQENILNFFRAADTGNQFYLQSVECRTKSCRLEVNTENDSGWREFYFSMTHQDWYDSFTLQEESDYPGTVIYYLMRDEADGG